MTAFLPAVVPAGAARAGNGSHCFVGLSGYTQASPEPFFVGSEDVGSGFFTIVHIFQQDCTQTPRAHYRALDGTAVNGSDFTLASGWTGPLPAEGEGQTIPFPISDDGTEEVSETATIELDQAEGGLVANPKRVPLFIVDADGATRVAFHQATVAQSEPQIQVRLPVFRAGPDDAPIAVSYTIEPGSVNPATPGDDYQATSPGVLNFAAGERVKLIQFTLVNDSVFPAEPNETIQVSLQEGTGYEVASPNPSVLSILDDENDQDPPVTRWHHPRQDWTYSPGDYRIREVHVFGRDEGLSGIVEIDMALRKNFKDGHCSWWTPGSGFVRGPCGPKVWVPMEDGGPGLENWPYFYVKDVPRLKPSTGTAVKNYTAWCRATDGQGNVETTFERGRNLSTFEVARR
ncbi:MAG TPA: Calx-beta domain-containing protein [Actinomycetota bacterium]|nr:Calx-beta domain-containing protein [Actinomycetota bacterium]